ncbi:hypothetical protein P168DRAFT_282461 [Aspergillus campestris IBT 28561]|uniref:Uncharacterized protein n=1 Tax=Aspergillus campestris (strain IBT 28561) TaxID=1392248 RepID=A0A2I1D1K6_ASPC2|nr:uncharacterized protein P168DRAFT_282461 [Aspergillus campestris IBT 28561]PKY03746.1 hypothetical protein P168DRAFT_282461 [Aspergillus campestris IBT 28561]
MMDAVDFELCLDVDEYRKKPQPQNQPDAETKAKAEPETTPLLNNAPPKSPLVRKYAQFVEDEYTTLSRKKENDNGHNDTGFWLSLPPKRPRLSPSELGVGLEERASTVIEQYGTVGCMGSTGVQGRGEGACAGAGTDAGVDGDGDTMMDVDADALSDLPIRTTIIAPSPATATATITPPPSTPTPGRMPARPSRPPPSASTQFAIYEDPDTMDVDDTDIRRYSTPLHSPTYNTTPGDGQTTTSNNNSHYIHPYVSSQTDEDKENTENENEDDEEDRNTGETHSSQQSTLTSLTEGDHHHHHHRQQYHQRDGENEDQESQADDEADDDNDDIYSRDSATTPFRSPPSRRMTLTRRRRPHQYYTYHPHGYLGQRPGYEYGFVEGGSDTSTNADISTSVRGFVGGEPSWNRSPGSSSTITAFGGREGRERGDVTPGIEDGGGIADSADPVDIRQEMLSSTAVPGDYHRSRGGLRRVYPWSAGGSSGQV